MAGAVTKFALSGLAALVLVGIGDVVVLRRIGTSEAIRDARVYTQVAGRGIVEPSITDALIREDPTAVALVDQLVHQHVLGDPVVRVKIWTEDGRIVYSDEPSLIDSVYPLDDNELDALRTGTVAADLSDLSAPENRFERTYGQLLEVYLPVKTPAGQPLLFEAYLRFSSVAASGQKIWLSFVPALLLALVVLAVVQVPLAWSMARRIRQGQQDREALLRRAIEASETERRRIASDVHDGVVQDLVGLSYSLAATADRLGRDAPPAVASELRRAAATTRQSMRELRTLLVEIYPPNLHTAGLEAALSDLLAPVVARGIKTDLDLPPAMTLTREAEALMFRTAQEALRNTLAYADARNVKIKMTLEGGRAELVVEDDGRGFTQEELEARRAEGHVGLRLLTDLVSDAGGVVDIDSQPGRGTRIRVEVPNR